MVSLRAAVGAVAGLPRDLLRARRGDASAVGTYLLMRRAHVWTAGRSTAALSETFRRLPGAVDRVATGDGGQLDIATQAAAAALAADGICSIADVFTPAEVAELVDFATTGPATLMHGDGSRSVGTYRDRGADVVSVTLDQAFVLTRPAVQAMMARAVAAQIARGRFGMWPTVHPPALYWSCHGHTQVASTLEERLARRYHSDFDGLGGLRLHVYLTDVDEGAAPMDYVRTSHRTGAIPRSLRRDVTDEITESTVRDLFPQECLRRFTGPAGTSFMSDSNGLHRGNSPTTADRLFLVMPMQAGSFAGAYQRIRQVPVVDEQFGLALRARRPDLRLLRAAPAGSAKYATVAD